MVWNSNVVKLIGDDKVEGITVKNSVDGSEKDIQVSGLFYCSRSGTGQL